MQTCAKCHASWAESFKYCPNDGSPLGATAKAHLANPRLRPRCGANYPGAKFCPHDGTALEPAR